EVEQLCDRVAILRDGVVVAEGAPRSLLREGERLFVRFDTPAESAAAVAVLGNAATATPAGPNGGAAILVEVPAVDASRINRTLAGAGLHPAEITIQRQSLEAVFRELTIESDERPGPVAGAAAPDHRPQ
ncbi:MAG TPA: hypothetical protein VFY18_15120, partial [Candidatus Limnocylindrales bacterium]|nr:hypothetical protein [Candidatus Limnocylindrales bacterium]